MPPTRTEIAPTGHKAALKSAKVGMAREKQNANWPNLAGVSLSALGRHREAVPMFQKALKINPGFTDARRNLAQTLILLQRHETARNLLEPLTQKSPDDGDAWYLLAQCHMAGGGFPQAEQAITRAIDSGPKKARDYRLRALIRERSGRIDAALTDYEAALELNPNHVETLVSISLPLARQLRVDEAEAAVRRAISIDTAHIGARLRLGMHLVESGRTDEAVEVFRAALEIAPNDAEAIEQLAAIQTSEQNRELDVRALTALSVAPRKSTARASLHFARARIAAQAGDKETARTERAAANREMALILPYDRRLDAALVEKLIARFASPIATFESQGQSPLPVYVLGLPRSGTTLAEAILGAHPEVTALGERTAAGSLLQRVIDLDLPFDLAAIEAFRAGDKAMMPNLSEDTRAYVDKMPENYWLIGFLKSAYPHCRIINITRDPRDIALSMWQGRFSGTALNYTYDLSAMAHRFNLYARMMAHWRTILPGQILDVAYEAMVSDVASAGQSMAAFCALDWREEMANPNEHAGQVLTMSAMQLRQPVHTHSVGKWREFAEELAPLIRGLDPELWPGLSD